MTSHLRPAVATQSAINPLTPRDPMLCVEDVFVELICRRCGGEVGRGFSHLGCDVHPNGCPPPPPPEPGSVRLFNAECDAAHNRVVWVQFGQQFVVLGRSDTPRVLPITCPKGCSITVQSSEVSRFLAERVAELPFPSKKRLRIPVRT